MIVLKKQQKDTTDGWIRSDGDGGWGLFVCRANSQTLLTLSSFLHSIFFNVKLGLDKLGWLWCVPSCFCVQTNKTKGKASINKQKKEKMMRD